MVLEDDLHFTPQVFHVLGAHGFEIDSIEINPTGRLAAQVLE